MTEKQSKRVALITGAAGGIGVEIVAEFARRGYDVAIVDLDSEALNQVAADAESCGVQALAFSGDLTDLEFAESTVRTTVEKLGRIDVLVNNAAWREMVSMREISPESWDRCLRICLTVPAFMARWAAEDMETRRSGVIVNVSSLMSQQAAGLFPGYVAAKGGIDSLTYELASLYGDVGLRVVAVCPGAIETSMSRDYATSGEKGTEDPIRDFSIPMIPLGRWGQPEEIARVIAWVASDEASYITGTTILSDGGWFHSHFPKSLRNQ